MVVAVRKAAKGDMAEIMSMGHAMTKEGPWLASFSEDVARDRIEQSMELGCCFVADSGERLVGITIGFPANYWYSEEEFVGELVLYVAPDSRRLGVADELIDCLEIWASQRCIEDVIITPASGVAHSATLKMLERRGYAAISTSMRKRL